MRWPDSFVVVTGASRGIGREVAKEAAARGATVGLIARNAHALGKVLDEIGGRGHVIAADVSDYQQITSAIENMEKRFGRIDGLVNNAGAGGFESVVHERPETYEQLMRVNYLSVAWGTQAVLPGMVKRRTGNIVNVGSIAGRIGAPFESAYSGSKFAVVGFTESIAVELAPLGITVSMVNPGPVQTGFFEARGRDYEGDFPRPVPARRVSKAIIRALEQGTSEQVIPRWLRFANAMKTVAPPLYRAGSESTFKSHLNELKSRVEADERDQ